MIICYKAAEFVQSASCNYLILKGVLNADKPRLQAQVRQAIEQPEQAGLRSERMRGL